MSKQTCSNCMHAKWQRGPSGKVIWQRKGECTVEYFLDDAPHCVREAHSLNLKPARRAIGWHVQDSANNVVFFVPAHSCTYGEAENYIKKLIEKDFKAIRVEQKRFH